MNSINPFYLFALVVVIVFAVGMKLFNADKEYSTKAYWESATLASVDEVPDSTLQPGNKNGGVLMWAAMVTDDPAILAALVARGADINEVDPVFSGTPLTAAAASNSNPEIITELVRLGADMGVKVAFQNTALMTAALYNQHPGIIEALVAQGARVDDQNILGQTALDLAKLENNQTAIDALSQLSD